MFEHKTQPLLSRWAFFGRMARSALAAAAIVVASLALGTTGYHFFGGLTWLDSLLNASMILTGMGPVNPITSTSGKLFATFYALYSGIAFLTLMAVLASPIVHRIMHQFHLEEEGEDT